MRTGELHGLTQTHAYLIGGRGRASGTAHTEARPLVQGHRVGGAREAPLPDLVRARLAVHTPTALAVGHLACRTAGARAGARDTHLVTKNKMK